MARANFAQNQTYEGCLRVELNHHYLVIEGSEQVAYVSDMKANNLYRTRLGDVDQGWRVFRGSLA